MTPTITPTIKQHQAWERLKDNITTEVCFGGAAGGGKSHLGCEWLQTSSFFYPGSQWFIGRNSLKDLRESTVISWHKVLKHHKIKAQSLFTYNGQDYYFKFHNGSIVWLLDCAYYPSDPFFERFGSREFTGGWFEEGGEIHPMAYQILSSRVGRMYNDKYGLLGKVLTTCNPKKNFLYEKFYKPWKKGELPPDKAFIQSLHTDNPHVDSGYGAVLQKLTGVARQRLLLGDWEYDEDANSLIEYEKILDIFKNNHMNGGVHYITVDVARKGQDSTVIGLWSGFGVRFFQYEKLLTTEVTKKVKQLQEKYRISASNIIVDEDGVGGGVCDQLQCQGFVNNSRPLPNYSNPQLDQRGNIIVENFDNLKSQCYFRLADRINKGHLFVDCEEPEMIERIIQELEQVKQKDIDSDKKKGVVPKEEVKEILGRSPDFSDCLMMREYFELKPSFVIAAG
jgi:hypothetical protein